MPVKLVLCLLVTQVLHADWNVLPNPEMKPMTLGVESEKYRWAQYPKVEGAYGENGEYTIYGNGHGVYWCRDGAAMARVVSSPLNGEFTFTARLKDLELPDGISQVGILVKGILGTRENVLALRWDTYWAGASETGLTWFNRVAPTALMEDMVTAYSEKLCHGTGQGCLGMGYENTVPGYSQPENLWFRVKRIIEDGKDFYELYARKDSESEWTPIQPVTSTHNPCGATQTPFEEPMNLGAFRVPETSDGRVYVGLYVANGSHGKEFVTATFDNITIEGPDLTETPPELLPMDYSEDSPWWPMYSGPNGGFSTPANTELEPKPYNWVRRWKSERIPPGRQYPDPPEPGCDTLSIKCQPQSGGSSLIAKDGRVYHFFYKSQYNESDQSWSATANEYVLCLDAKTGETIWKKIVGTGYDAGRGGRYSKGIIYNHSPAITDGKLFVCGTSGIIRCLNPENGEQIWASSASPRPMSSALIIAGDVLVVGTDGGRIDDNANIVGYDIDDGSQLWTVPNSMGGNATPSRWVHNGKEYIIAAHTINGTRCIDPATGDILWHIEKAGHNATIPVGHDYMVLNTGLVMEDGEQIVGKRSDGVLTGYRISPLGAEELWKKPELPGFFDRNAAAVRGDTLYTVLGKEYFSIHIPTGTILGRFEAVRGCQQVQILDNIMLAENDCCHGCDETYVINADASDFELTMDATWVPRAMPTSSYVTPIVHAYADGRLFVRGLDAVYCFDMRKQPGIASSSQPISAKLAKRGTSPIAAVTTAAGTAIRVLAPEGSTTKLAVYQVATGRLIENRTLHGPKLLQLDAAHAAGAYVVEATTDGNKYRLLTTILR